MTWKHITCDEFDTVSPHDCFADKIVKGDDSVTFSFSDGLWLSHLHPANPHGQTAKTAHAEISLKCEGNHKDAPLIYLFKPTRLLGRNVMTRRVSVTLDKFAKFVNSGKWELELLDVYRAYRTILLKGVIHSGTDMFECELYITCDRVEYRWNELQQDRFW